MRLLFVVWLLLFCLTAFQGFQLKEEKDEIRGRWLEPSPSHHDFVDKSEHASMPGLLRSDDKNDNIDDEEENEGELDEIYDDIHNVKDKQDPLWIRIPTPRIPVPRIPTPRIPPIRIPTPRIPTPRIPTPRIPTPRFPPFRFPTIRIPFIRFPPLQIPSINLGPPLNPIKIVTGHFDKVKQTVTDIGGKVKNIDWKQVGKELGQAAGKTFNFLNCAFPGLSSLFGCAKDVIDSAKSCVNGGSNCHIAIGGQNSKCLHLSVSDQYIKSYGPAKLTGTSKANLNLGFKAYLNSGKISVVFSGDVRANAKVELSLQRTVQKKYKKRVALSKVPKRIFKKLFTIVIGNVPVPVMLEILAQPVARINIDAKASGSFYASLSMKEDARISLDGLMVEYEPNKGLPKLYAKASQNINRLHIVKTANVQASASVTAVFQIGVEITFKINGVPLKTFPNFEMKLHGIVGGQASFVPPFQPCFRGLLTLSTALNVMVVPDVMSFTSVADNFNNACVGLVDTVCKNPLTNVAKCIHSEADICKKANEGCNAISTQLAKIPNPIENNPLVAVFKLITGPQTLVNLSGNICTG